MKVKEFIERAYYVGVFGAVGAGVGALAGAIPMMAIAASYKDHQLSNETFSLIYKSIIAGFAIAGMVYGSRQEPEWGTGTSRVETHSELEDSVGSSTGGIGDDSAPGGYNSVGR